MGKTWNPPPGSRHLKLKKSFKLGLHSILTGCSKEEFMEVFPQFNAAERESLYRLFVQVIASLHANIEDEFESLCRETEVGRVLGNVEQLVDEQSLDPLFSDQTNVGDIKRSLSRARENEIQYLKARLESVEEQKSRAKARVEHLKKEASNSLGTSNAVEKFRSQLLNYGTTSGVRLDDSCALNDVED